jgi:hypothetical protein
MGCRPVEHVILVRLADDDDPVDAPGNDEFFQPVILFGKNAGKEKVVSLVGKGIGQMADHGRKERVGQMLCPLVPQREQYGNRAGSAEAKILGGDVEAKTVFGGKSANTVSGLLVKCAFTSQSARDSRYRHAGNSGKV